MRLLGNVYSAPKTIREAQLISSGASLFPLQKCAQGRAWKTIIGEKRYQVQAQMVEIGSKPKAEGEKQAQ
jgi:hypothetical protein